MAQAEANLAYAEAVLAELVAGSRSEDIDRAEARVLQARESLTELQHGSRSEEIESGRAELASARAAEQSAIVQANQAKADFERYANLFKEGSVSKNVFETYQNNLKTAENQVKEAGCPDQGGQRAAGPSEGRTAHRTDRPGRGGSEAGRGGIRPDQGRPAQGEHRPGPGQGPGSARESSTRPGSS